MIPNAGLKWHLTDTEGKIINSREDVEILTPAITVNIILSGADLEILDGRDTYRILTIEGTYNSVLGDNLPFKDSARFLLTNLIYE